jgi:hypothetical protein
MVCSRGEGAVAHAELCAGRTLRIALDADVPEWSRKCTTGGAGLSNGWARGGEVALVPAGSQMLRPAGCALANRKRLWSGEDVYGEQLGRRNEARLLPSRREQSRRRSSLTSGSAFTCTCTMGARVQGVDD